MWLLLRLCFTSSLIHSVQMLKCLDNSNLESKSLVTCRDNHYCAVLRTNLDGFSRLSRSCVGVEMCYFLKSTTSYNVGYFNTTISCCNTDACNDGDLPEHYAASNGRICESCNSTTDDKCNTLLSCVGIQDCCLKDFSDIPSYPAPANLGKKQALKGCASSNFCLRIPGNLGYKSTVHNFCLLSLSLSLIFLK